MAGDDAATEEEDSLANPVDVLVNDSDVDGDALSITAVTAHADGVVTINDAGTPLYPTDDFIDYTPDPDSTSLDSFSYTVSDGALSDTATVTDTVNP